MNSLRRFFLRCATFAPVAIAIATFTRSAAAEPPASLPLGPPPADAPPPWPASSPWSISTTREIIFQASGSEAVLETLEYGEHDKKRWRPLCHAPCRTMVYAGAAYRVSGPGVKTSPTFVVPPGETAFHLDAKPGSKAQWVTGVVLIPVGGGSAAIGLVAYAFAGGCWVEQCRHDASEVEAQRVAAGGMMIAGAAILATGVLLMTSNRTTLDFGDTRSAAVSLGGGISLTPGGFVF